MVYLLKINNWWDSLAKEWDNIIVEPHSHYDFIFKIMDSRINKVVKKADLVLELGCGTGDSTKNIMRFTHGDTIAIDFSQKMIEEARKKIFSKNKIVDFVLANISSIPFKNNIFDAVVGRGAILSYVKNPDIVLMEVKRVLKNGGQIGIDLVSKGMLNKLYNSNLGWLVRYRGNVYYGENKKMMNGYETVEWYLINKNNGLYSICPSTGWLILNKRPTEISSRDLISKYDYKTFTPKEIFHLFSRVGFKNIKIYPCGNFYHLIKYKTNSGFLLEKLVNNMERMFSSFLSYRNCLMFFVVARN